MGLLGVARAVGVSPKTFLLLLLLLLLQLHSVSCHVKVFHVSALSVLFSFDSYPWLFWGSFPDVFCLECHAFYVVREMK
jgi:hypothetical protein